MARPFSTGDAARLMEQHRALREKLETAAGQKDVLQKNIRQAARAMVEQEVLGILRTVPVEELNRDKRGVKTKLLRENRYDSLADLSAATAYELSTIRGISEDSALLIKSLVRSFAERTGREVRIRLSADDRSLAPTRLVSAIAAYERSLPAIALCRELLERRGDVIAAALGELDGVNGTLKWLFASQGRRAQGAEAYETLRTLFSGNYGESAREALVSLRRAAETAPDAAWEDFQRDPIRYFTALEEASPGLLESGDRLYGLPEELAREIQDECLFPDGLLCTLRRYQEWGVKYILHQGNVLLGDEMGLGKTVQAIAAMVSLKNVGGTHFLVVCPASVLTNWCREIQKHSLLRVTKLHGPTRAMALRDWLARGGVGVTTYETTASLALPEDFRFALLVVDEAHYIKNPQAQRTIHVNRLSRQAQRRLFMTGTALENRVDEMISLIGFLRPDIAARVRSLAFMSAAEQFREKIAPVYYRRKREDVLSELPELIESREWCTLSRAEEARYETALLSGNYADVRRVSWHMEDVETSAKARRLRELVEEAAEEGRKVIVFSFFLDTIRLVQELLGERCTAPINGSVPVRRRQEILDAFDAAPPGAVLPAQIQSGGTGLNIQSASVVVICEPQFKPSVENQAISRAYRMGQARNVLVYRLLCEDTVDERIMELLEEKQAVFDAFADESAAAKESFELDERSFGDIIREEIERIRAKNAALPESAQ